MIERIDPYRVLHVRGDAPQAAIRSAYRALARRHHPDLGGTHREMATINAAWWTLRDPVRRARYDRETRAAAAPVRTQPGPARAPEPFPIDGLRPRPVAGDRSVNVLDFGRHAGEAIADVARRDPDYLEWLARTPIGRGLKREIDRALAAARPAAPPSPTPLRARLARRR